MKILTKINSATERTIVYEHNGERGSLTRPAIIGFDAMEREIEKRLSDEAKERSLDRETIFNAESDPNESNADSKPESKIEQVEKKTTTKQAPKRRKTT